MPLEDRRWELTAIMSTKIWISSSNNSVSGSRQLPKTTMVNSKMDKTDNNNLKTTCRWTWAKSTRINKCIKVSRLKNKTWSRMWLIWTTHHRNQMSLYSTISTYSKMCKTQRKLTIRRLSIWIWKTCNSMKILYIHNRFKLKVNPAVEAATKQTSKMITIMMTIKETLN